MRTFAPVVLFLTLILTLIPAAAALALSVSPGVAWPGQLITLDIFTPGHSWSNGVTVSLGPNVSVASVVLVRPDLLQVQAAVEFGAPLGPRDVVVTQGNQQLTEPGAFRITQVDHGGAPANPPVGANAIVNPGFETGTMAGWIPVTWSISTVQPHGGVFDAYDPGGSGGGGQCLRQNFSPAIDSDDVTNFSFWLRQPDDLGIAQVILFHQNAGQVIGVAFTNDNDTWTFEDFTSLRRPNDFITGCHVCGFGGGQSTPDDSWADDFLLDVGGATAVEPATWGAIKAALR